MTCYQATKQIKASIYRRPRFHKFLKKNKAFAKYVNESVRQGVIIPEYVTTKAKFVQQTCKVIETNINPINSRFSWERSFEGSEYWEDLCWKYYEELKKNCPIYA